MGALIKNHFIIFVLIVVSFIPLIDLFHLGLPVTHDGRDHVARIANFYQNLKEGNIVPRWAGNLNWGYGHPILMFLYPLPSYVASLFHFLGFSLVDSVKIVFGLSFIASGLAMFLWIKEFLDEKAAFISAMLYMFAPYRFVDLYVRGAIGEHVAFIFPPLIFYFILKLSRELRYSYIIGGAFSFSGLILSHNAITLMFLPIIFLYGLYLVLQNKERKYFISHALYLILLGFGISAFFWLPAFIEGKYTLRDIVTSGIEYAVSFVYWKDFIFSKWSFGGTLFFSKQVGIIQWISVIGSIFGIFYLYKRKSNLWILCFGGFLVFWVVLFMMTSNSSIIWEKVSILQKFQFPWRFLSLTVFLSALLGAIALYLFKGQYRKVFLLIFIVGLLMVNKDYWRANGFLHKPENFYSGIYNSTTDTGESAPIWSVRFMEKRPKAHIEIIQGTSNIKEVKRSFTNHIYQINATARSRIRENTLYFPGWNVFVDGKKTEVEFQDQKNRGLITFFVDKGKHNVEIKFGETKLRLFADMISVAALGIIVILLFYAQKKSILK